MDTNTNDQQHPVTAWCRTWFDRFVASVQAHSDREITGPRAVGIALLALAGIASAVTLVGWLLYQFVRGLQIAGAAVSSAADVEHGVASWPVVEFVVDAIAGWVKEHSAGLPVATGTLLAMWALGGAVLALAGVLGSRGARIAWPVYGVATAAMAYGGAAGGHQTIAAGLVGLAWGVASIVVLHRVPGERHRTIVHVHNVTHERPAPTDVPG